MRKLPETINEDEFIKLVRAVKKGHHRIAFILGFYGAMRVSEVANLKQEDIDKGQKIIRIKQAKGNKDRNIPLPPEAIRGLKYIPMRCKVRALQTAITYYGNKILNKKIHFHTLRHSGATHYLNKKGWSSRQVQVLLGHSRLQTTEIYTHVTPQDLINLMYNDSKEV